MIVISHRGNIDGPNPKTENKPHQIEKVISMDVQVEIDVRFVENSWYLGQHIFIQK